MGGWKVGTGRTAIRTAGKAPGAAAHISPHPSVHPPPPPPHPRLLTLSPGQGFRLAGPDITGGAGQGCGLAPARQSAASPSATGRRAVGRRRASRECGGAPGGGGPGQPFGARIPLIPAATRWRGHAPLLALPQSAHVNPRRTQVCIVPGSGCRWHRLDPFLLYPKYLPTPAEREAVRALFSFLHFHPGAS